ncbi:MAG: BACON domain-containing protein [Paludibacter sp.]
MKLIKIIILLSITLLWSCKDNFLDEKNDILKLADTTFMTDVDIETILPIIIPGTKNEQWKIIQYPAWLTVNNKSGVLDNGRTSIRLKRNTDFYFTEFGYSYSPFIIDVQGIGFVEIPFVYGCFGRPVINYNYNTFDFSNVDKNTLSVNNSGSGYFAWYILSKPEWMNVSANDGVLNANQTLDLIMTVDKENKPLGNYLGKVIIANNSTIGYMEINVSMTLTQLTLSGGITNFEGEIVASEYNKPTDLMYILTQNPNKLTIINGISTLTQTIVLDELPTCASFSANGSTILIGYSTSKISVVDVNKNTISKTIKTDCPACSIVNGDNGWGYVATNYTQKLRSINLNTNEVFRTSFTISGNPIIKKAPGKAVIYCTTPGYSPSGLSVCDISNGLMKDTIDSYFTYVGNMWFSEDGNQLFIKESTKAYYTPPYLNGKYASDNQNIVMKGKYSTSESRIDAFDYNATTNCFWVGVVKFGNNSEVYQFKATDFTNTRILKVKSITDSNGTKYVADINWIFSNKEGTYLYYIKQTDSEYSYPSNWQLEKIKL